MNVQLVAILQNQKMEVISAPITFYSVEPHPVFRLVHSKNQLTSRKGLNWFNRSQILFGADGQETSLLPKFANRTQVAHTKTKLVSRRYCLGSRLEPCQGKVAACTSFESFPRRRWTRETCRIGIQESG